VIGTNYADPLAEVRGVSVVVALMAWIKSIGKGKTIVELLSPALSLSVPR
jgi:hypothetical protein